MQRQGADVVYGFQEQRQGDAIRRWTGRAYYALFNAAQRVPAGTISLNSRSMPIGLATDTQWRTLERGSALEIGRTLATLDIRYVLIQTAQPSPRVFQRCVHDQEPLVRSGLLTVDATTRYFFELYGLGDCREGR